MDTNIGHPMGHKYIKTEDNNVLDIKDIRNRSLQVFENKEYFNLAVLKAERLASAIYLVSNLISDTEHLKWMVRRVSADIISDISLVGAGATDKGQKVSLEKITAKIFEITSMLQVAWIGGLISNMNFEILRAEYFKLGEFLKEKFYSVTPDRLLVSKDFFVSSDIKNLEELADKTKAENKVTEEKFFDNLNENLRHLNARHTFSGSADSHSHLSGNKPYQGSDSKFQARDISYKGHAEDKAPNVHLAARLRNEGVPSSIQRSLKTNSAKMSDKNKEKRHALILSLLKPGMIYSVPEILALIGMGKQLSEKTIQRDLIQLVSNGSLKKTGERRWSRYQLP